MDNIDHKCEQDRKHQCEICKKRFKRRTHLDIHARIHSGVKPLVSVLELVVTILPFPRPCTCCMRIVFLVESMLAMVDCISCITIFTPDSIMSCIKAVRTTYYVYLFLHIKHDT